MAKYRSKWYDSKAWLKVYFIDKGMTTAEIAEFAGVSERTIRDLLVKHGLKRGR